MSSEVFIRLAHPLDRAQLAALFEALWPDSSAEEHNRELSLLLEGQASLKLPLIILVAESEGEIVGFIEVGLRSHADCCDPSQAVGFIEGWYVGEDCRREGIGRKLLVAAEEWALSQGCAEMASDTSVDNEVSQRVHQALGYMAVDRCVHFRKPLVR